MPEVMNAIVITIILRPIEDVARVLPRDICIVPDFCGVATCQMKDAANFAKLLNGGEFAEQGGQTDIRAVGNSRARRVTISTGRVAMGVGIRR